LFQFVPPPPPPSRAPPPRTLPPAPFRAQVWDYQTKACVQTLEGHAHNVSAVAFHPELPLLVTGGEDGAVRLWHSATWRLESTVNYGMERCWALAVARGSNAVAAGYDEGVAMLGMGREEPVASMDAGGKVVWARHHEVQAANLRAAAAGEDGGAAGGAEADGERLPLAVKDLGASEMYPQSLAHSPNGRFVAVCGDGEYVVYTALAWRNKAFGPAQEFAWADDSNAFATREGGAAVKVHRNFKEALQVRVPFQPEGIHGGRLLAVRAADFVVFYDWATGAVVRRVDVPATAVYWSDSGATVVIATAAAFFVLAYDADAVEAALAGGTDADEDGVEAAFDLQAEVADAVKSAAWAGDAFIYASAGGRLCYAVGGEVATLAHLDRPMHVLGYLAAQSKVFLIDREHGVCAYALPLAVVEYKTLVLRGDAEGAAAALGGVPDAERDSVARFLEARGDAARALEVATDPGYRFELAVGLGDLETAAALAEAAGGAGPWRAVGELALAAGSLEVAERAFRESADFGGLLLLATARGDAPGAAALADAAAAAGRHNVAFACRFLLGDADGCLEVLRGCGRLPEAALFARSYRPSRASACVKEWAAELAKVNPKAAEALADPEEFPNLFPGWAEALAAEAALGAAAAARGAPPRAGEWPRWEAAGLGDAAARLAALGVAAGGLAAAAAAGGGGGSPAAVTAPAPPSPPAAAAPQVFENDVFEEAAEEAAAEEAAAEEEAEAEADAFEEEPAAAPAPPPAPAAPAAAPPPPPAPATPAPAPGGLTAEEEALLAEDLAAGDDDAALGEMSEAELAAAAAALGVGSDDDDDWGA
jgi:coatomer subunit beta'